MDPGTGHKRDDIAWFIGHAVGEGGTTISTTIWVRPPLSDFDGRAKPSGDAARCYDAALKIFRDKIREPAGRGQPVSQQGRQCPRQEAANPPTIASALPVAAAKPGLPAMVDLNGAHEVGIGGFARLNQIIGEGRWVNIARAYLYRVIDRPHITVLGTLLVTGLVIKGGKVTGIRALRDGAPLTRRAARELVLSAGAIRTPQILRLSGIGGRDHLPENGNGSVLDAPDMGMNVHDHLLHGGSI
ncbi:GMC family oxidoreductase N-terminal domain-containing protein [Gemmobacter sp. 24YEA27]|uniref:GMC family oxidoreductase N-terminal domain-containing protein n=1 Tax=Gemmobacter sp. 24YEA27 TaxID=3040672 RepID=UPI0024B3A206|nr:GMC family oxidoreductase N-terminal domain-containing protein [Gemmobacter sp. 24YEA27]